MKPDGGDQLVSKAMAAAKWNYLGNAARMAVQFGAGVLLARMLGPNAFGVVAIAWIMIGAGKLVSDLGFSAALIQRRDIEERDIEFIFFVQVLLGAFMSIAGYLSAGLVSAFFNKPEARPVIEAMASLFVITAIGQAGVAVLTRQLNMRFVQGTSIATYLVGYILIGLPAAHMGHGVWSLVAAQLAQSSLYSLMICIKSGILIRPSFRPSSKGLFGFGSKVMAANIANWAVINVDGILVGRYLGLADLGIYNRTMTLVSTPTAALVGGLQNVLFSTASRLQDDLSKVSMMLIACIQVMTAVCLPAFLIIALAPETVIGGVYGESWMGAVPVLVPLAISMPVIAMLSVIGPVLTALNRADLEARAQLMTVAVISFVVFIAAQHSLVTVAWAVLFSYVFRLLLLLTAICQVLGTGFLKLISELVPHVAFGFAVALTVTQLFALIEIEGAGLRLVVLMLISILVIPIYLRIFGPFLLKGAIMDILGAGSRLPSWARYWMRVGN